MLPQDVPRWHKNYFELKAFEFLKSFACLNWGIPKELNCYNLPFQEQLLPSWLEK